MRFVNLYPIAAVYTSSATVGRLYLKQIEKQRAERPRQLAPGFVSSADGMVSLAVDTNESWRATRLGFCQYTFPNDLGQQSVANLLAGRRETANIDIKCIQELEYSGEGVIGTKVVIDFPRYITVLCPGIGEYSDEGSGLLGDLLAMRLESATRPTFIKKRYLEYIRLDRSRGIVSDHSIGERRTYSYDETKADQVCTSMAHAKNEIEATVRSIIPLV